MKGVGILVFGLVALLAAGCGAQPSLNDVALKLQSLCPEAIILEVEYKKNYVEVDYECRGRNHELALTHEMVVLYTEEVPDIPTSVKTKIDKKLSKNYPDWVEDEYTLIDLGDTAFYKFEMLRSGVEQNVYFSLTGKYFDSEGLAIIRNQEVQSLENSDGYSTSLYDFLRPTRTLSLPKVLVEISGVSVVDNRTLWAVQDELGAVFKIDSETGKVLEVLRFTDVGDFEDLVVVGDKVYVLRSDGALFSFGFDSANKNASHQMLPVGCLDLEGLHYSEADETWWVACKEPVVGRARKLRTVYQFSAGDFSQSVGEFLIDETEISQLLATHFPETNWGNRAFNPSAIATHPHNGHLYVLSADDRTLAVYSGPDLREVYPLPEAMYFKPEGLDFAPDGTLYLSSEGQKKGNKPGQIFVFPMKNRP